MSWYWWLLEWIPKPASRREWPKRRTFLGLYIPWAEPRFIAPEAWVHSSVYQREARVESYRPVNLPPKKNLEP
jgi:hypothetical protein